MNTFTDMFMLWTHDEAEHSTHIIPDVELQEGYFGYPLEVVDVFSMYHLFLLNPQLVNLSLF